MIFLVEVVVEERPELNPVVAQVDQNIGHFHFDPELYQEDKMLGLGSELAISMEKISPEHNPSMQHSN